MNVKDIAPKGWVTTMEHGGYKAQLMRAKRLRGEGVFELPMGQEIPVYPISVLPGSPKSWVRMPGTYVCPVDSEWGLWFDWTMNDGYNTAILPSVKGVNPITGQKLKGFGLEEFKNYCPIHKEPFTHGRLCDKCGYEWPPQNYVSYPGILWWDGWRKKEGVAQFFFTDEVKRDIASSLIGEKSTVPAFGFAFFDALKRRESSRSILQRISDLPTFHKNVYSASTGSSYPDWYKSQNPWLTGNPPYNNPWTGDPPVDFSRTTCLPLKSFTEFSSSPSVSSSSSASPSGTPIPTWESPIVSQGLYTKRVKKSSKVAVGAGAFIDQKLEQDTLGLDGWNKEPSAVIRLYFCFEEEFRSIVKLGGVKELVSNPQGYLDGLPVG